MGTNNFYNKNASNIFACSIEEEFDFYDLKDNLNCEINRIKMYKVEENSGHDCERNCNGTYINYLKLEHKECSLILQPIIRSGYYDGCNLDYEIQVYASRGEYRFETVQDMIDHLRYEELSYKCVEKLFTKHLPLMVAEIERIYKLFSIPLKKLGQFSGEAIYQKVG